MGKTILAVMLLGLTACMGRPMSVSMEIDQQTQNSGEDYVQMRERNHDHEIELEDSSSIQVATNYNTPKYDTFKYDAHADSEEGVFETASAVPVEAEEATPSQSRKKNSTVSRGFVLPGRKEHVGFRSLHKEKEAVTNRMIPDSQLTRLEYEGVDSGMSYDSEIQGEPQAEASTQEENVEFDDAIVTAELVAPVKHMEIDLNN